MLKYGENLFNNIIGIETNGNHYMVDETVQMHKISKIKVELSNSGVPVMYLLLTHKNYIIGGIPSSNVTKVYFDKIEEEPTEIKIEEESTYAKCCSPLKPLNTGAVKERELTPPRHFNSTSNTATGIKASSQRLKELNEPININITVSGSTDTEKILDEIVKKMPSIAK